MKEEDESKLEEKIGRLYDEELSKTPTSPLRMPLYIVGEKILIKSERIPEDWPIFSTTGYVFLNSVNGIFIDYRLTGRRKGIFTHLQGNGKGRWF